jgi:hypothetical protein
VVVLDSEIGTAMDINTLAWKRTPIGDPSATLDEIEIYMGLCATDELGTTFEDNYIPGTKTLVFSSSPFTISADPEEWAEVTLDTPFWYNGSDNLIIEVTWPNGSGSFYVYKWSSGSDRSLESGYGGTTGTLSQDVSHLQLIGDVGLEPSTFAEVKASL